VVLLAHLTNHHTLLTVVAAHLYFWGRDGARPGSSHRQWPQCPVRTAVP
jgi:hypothetical protein